MAALTDTLLDPSQHSASDDVSKNPSVAAKTNTEATAVSFVTTLEVTSNPRARRP